MPSRDDLEPGSAVEGLIARFAADPSLNKPSKAEVEKLKKESIGGKRAKYANLPSDWKSGATAAHPVWK